jgi:long-chain fatty acid transport protein
MGKKGMAVVTALILLLSSGLQDAKASGFLIYEHGARATGLAGTLTARGGDPSAIFYNPAGIAGLMGTQIYLGTTLIFPDGKFAGADPFPGFGVVEQYKSAVFFPSNLYITHQLGEQWTLGLGVFSPYGLTTEWDNPDTYSGRFLSSKAQLVSFYINPTVAYTLSPQVSVAVGLDLVTAMVELRRNNATMLQGTALDIARVKIKGSSGLSTGFNAGIIVRPVERLALGFQYRSKVSNSFDDGDATFEQISTGDPTLDAVIAAKLPKAQGAKTQIDFPASWSAGINYALSDRLDIEFNLNWTGWSSFDKIDLTFDDQELNTTIPEEWEDVFSYRVGIEYKASDRLRLFGGYLFDETPQPVQSISPLLPDANRNDFTFGFGYSFGKASVDVSNMFVFFKDRSTEGKNRDGYNGEYRVFAYLLGLNFSYAF